MIFVLGLVLGFVIGVGWSILREAMQRLDELKHERNLNQELHRKMEAKRLVEDLLKRNT